MKKKFLTLTAAIVALFMINGEEASAKEKYEKCYGIAKKGKNDCGSKHTKHSCAGTSTKDADPNDFIAIPKGLCDRIVGGSTEPKG